MQQGRQSQQQGRQPQLVGREPQKLAAEVNTFSGGLITDASPINFPPNTCKDMDNIVLGRNGRNQRRLGMRYEASYVETTTSQSSNSNLAFNTFKWENAGGDPDKALMVIQCGTEFNVYDLDNTPVSTAAIYTKAYTSIPSTQRISFSTADGYLVAVNGDGTIYTYEFDGVTTITENTVRLLTRDLWGVDAVTTGTTPIDLREGKNVTYRPSSSITPDGHIYNLRNQSWGTERIPNQDDGERAEDPLADFRSEAGRFPSNADSVNNALYPDASDGSNPKVDRFWKKDAVENRVTNFEVARGHYIIDVLDRGASRLEGIQYSLDNQNLTNYNITLPDDVTNGGAKISTEYAGRIFYGGFTGAVTDGDDKSPNLSSYIFWSRLVRDRSDIHQCYQIADPTDKDDPELVADDGGFTRIDGAYNILGLVSTGSSLIIVAQNGVWRLLGGSDYGFAADNYVVERLSDVSCRSPDSIVYVDGSVVFWGDNGIYRVGTDQFGDWKVVSLTRDRIQTLYDAIPSPDKEAAFGVFDKFDRKIRWLYNNRIGSASETKELVLDVDLDAFYKNSINSISSGLPKVVAMAEINPFESSADTENVTVNGAQVQVNTVDDVQVTASVATGTIREIVYVTLTQLSPVVKYTLSTYRATDFLDFFDYDSTGVDAAAYIITGEFPIGDYQRRKQAKLMCHLERTEDGTEDIGGGVLAATSQSSCMVQARWDWSDSANSNRWTVPRQFYRYKKTYTPADVNDDWDNGYDVIVTSDTLRGHGRALSLRFYTEAGKDMRLNGWSMVWKVGNNEGH